MLTLNDVNDLSASRRFDVWQSTERLHCTGATLLLLLCATCPFNEVEAASLSKQILFSAFYVLFIYLFFFGGGGYLIPFPSKAQFSLFV